MSSPEIVPYQYDRVAHYIVEKGSFKTGDYKWSPEAVMSDEIPYVSDRRLRLALELADIVQALDFPTPEMGGFPGGVTAIPRSRGCVVRRSDEYAAIYTDFPDDTIACLKQWLDENHTD